MFVGWRAPDLGTLKANLDTTVNVKKGHVGVGIIVRDGEGHVLAACSTIHILVVGPTMVEAWAAIQVVIFC